ncbi:hypothetical protein [Ancylobacter sp. IITR112]|uniref:hypothetical protein n=1 Tax=Ancylobacter sp. IITR112 TaxID=3138073 RepID=UPI00352B4F8F
MDLDLEAIRLRLGVPTQVGFAALLGISGQQYRKIIARTSPPTRTLTRLVHAYIAGYRPADWSDITVDRRRIRQAG